MENSFQTSFIPKRPVVSTTTTVTKKEPIGIFLAISIFLLIIMVLSSAGVFLYKNYLVNKEKSLSSSLSIARDSFEKDTIDELSLFNKRTEAAKKILSNHLVFSPMFSLLGDLTIPLIQYKKFEQDTTSSGTQIRIQGIAEDYRSIALQSDMFNNSKATPFKNVVFSNITKDKNNNINFNIEFDVDTGFLSYEKNFLMENIKDESMPVNNNSIPNNTENIISNDSEKNIVPVKTEVEIKDILPKESDKKIETSLPVINTNQ